MENENKYSKDQMTLFIVINIILLALITFASTSLTVSFFGSIGSGEVKTSNLLMGLVNDCCKIFLPIVTGIAMYKKKYFHAAVLVFIIGGTMYLSYLASQGLDLNTSNKALLDETGKQVLVTAKLAKDNEIITLENEKKGLISPIQSQIDKLPNNRISKKIELINNIKNITEQYRIKLEKVQSKVDVYNDKIENYKVDITMMTQGYHALARFTGLEVGTITKYKNIFMEILAIILSINLGLLIGESNLNIFNAVGGAIGGAVQYMKNRPKKPVVVKGFKQDEPERQSRTEKETIAPLPSLDSDIIKAYAKEAVNSYRHEDSSVGGLTTMSNRTGYSRTELTEAHTVLKHNSYIRTEGNTTYVDSIDKLKSLL